MEGKVQKMLGTQDLFSPSAASNGSRISVEVLSRPPACAHSPRAAAAPVLTAREPPPRARACRCAGPVQEHGCARRARTEAGAHPSAVDRQV
jgi:hypothetical protein